MTLDLQPLELQMQTEKREIQGQTAHSTTDSFVGSNGVSFQQVLCTVPSPLSFIILTIIIDAQLPNNKTPRPFVDFRQSVGQI